MTFRRDNRGLAVGLGIAFAGLIVAAFLFTMLYDSALADVITMTSAQADSTQAQNQINLAQAIANNILWVPLFIFVLFLVIRAVLEGSSA